MTHPLHKHFLKFLIVTIHSISFQHPAVSLKTKFLGNGSKIYSYCFNDRDSEQDNLRIQEMLQGKKEWSESFRIL